MASKLLISVRSLVYDILDSLRNASPPLPTNSLSALDLCQQAALKFEDVQCLRFTGNQYFNLGYSLFKAGRRKEARVLFEKSVELDFCPLMAAAAAAAEGGEGSAEHGQKVLQRCRKLEMLGECCQRGEEKV